MRALQGWSRGLACATLVLTLPGSSTDFGFQFVRIQYDSYPGLRASAWATDYPAADYNLHEAIDLTSGLFVEGPPLVLNLTDERIFEYPMLYLTEPGYWMTNDEEVAALRQYLDRGGFLLIDDFHDYGRGMTGPQWNNMYSNLKRVYPDQEPVEMTATHPIWSIYYDIDPVAAISTKNGLGWGRYEARFGPLDDVYYSLTDDSGRITVVICYNQDIGDGWEWPGGQNLGNASTISFQMAINFVMYALTH